MKKYLSLAVVILMSLFIGCQDEGPIQPTTEENWKYPSDSAKFSITLYTENDTVKAGSEFDVKVIFYNIPNVFGAAFEIGYASDKIDVSKYLQGPHFISSFNNIAKGWIDPIEKMVSFGITYAAGSNMTSSGSGIVMKLKCKAKTSGVAEFIINKQRLEIKKSDGSFINNFNNLTIENLKVVIK